MQHFGVASAANLTVQKIAEQIWFALYESSMLAWNEWRRTGFPVLIPAPDASGDYPSPLWLSVNRNEF